MALATGCAGSAPPAIRYEIPDLAWTEPTARAAAEQAPAHLGQLLGDPRLTQLIDTALANNPEIGIAAARVERVRAELISLRQQGLPEVSAEAGIGREFRRSSGQTLDFRSGQVQLDIAWEPDLFGRIRAENRAGLARARADEWERAAVEQAIVAQVARAWVQRATLNRRLQIYDEVIARSEELERIVRVRHAAGAATRVELGLQTIRVLELRQRRKELEQSLDRTRTALAQLTGAPAPGFLAADPLPAELSLPDLQPPPPRQLLALRPDILAAEARIRATDGDAQAARAAFFPRLSLSFVGMVEALSGQPTTQSLSLGSSLLAPIFDRGRLRRNLAVARADQLEAAEDYRRTILAALGEVEDLLKARSLIAQRSRIIAQITAESSLTARLGKAQYLEGEEDLRTLIDADELLSEAEEAQILAWEEQLLAEIALYQAIGARAAISAPAPDAERSASN